jgi:Tfp pilus assembly protein PilF
MVSPMTALTRRVFTLSNLSLLTVMLITGAVYWRVLAANFVYWDDDVEVYANPHLKGITPETLRWMFFGTGYVVRYQPLTWLTWSIIYEFFQLRPIGYHLASWLFYCLDAGLVFLLIRKLLLTIQPSRADDPRHRSLVVSSALGALLWALHPLRVEAVAWVSAFLHLQALLFLLISTLCYLEACSPGATGGRRRFCYWTSVTAFGVSLLSYPISLGFVIVPALLDVFLLQRLTPSRGSWRDPATRRIWLEKLPFLGVACLVLGITLLLRFNTSEQWARPATLANFGALHRLMQAFYIWAYYVWRPFVPYNLSPVYTTLVSFDPLSPVFLASAGLVCWLTLWLISKRRQWPALLASWLCYLVLLVPVLGLTEHPHYPSDRYSLVVGILWSLLAAGGLAKWSYPAAKRGAAMLALGLAIAGCTVLTVRQINIWKDSATLFAHVIRHLGDNPYRADIYWRLGLAQLAKGQPVEAVRSFQSVLEINPHDEIAHSNLANIAFAAGNYELARHHYTEVLRANKQNAEVHRLYAECCFHTALWDEAREHYSAALKAKPDDADLHTSLGIVFAALHNPAAAEEHLAQALRIHPDLASANYNLGLALKQQGKTNEAQTYFDKAERLKRGETPRNP